MYYAYSNRGRNIIYGAVEYIINIFQVVTLIATQPNITRPSVKKNHKMIPVNGLYFDPTISDVTTKNMTMVPGAKRPITKREKANTQKFGEKELRNATIIATMVDGFIILLRPYLKIIN